MKPNQKGEPKASTVLERFTSSPLVLARPESKWRLWKIKPHSGSLTMQGSGKASFPLFLQLSAAAALEPEPKNHADPHRGLPSVTSFKIAREIQPEKH